MSLLWRVFLSILLSLYMVSSSIDAQVVLKVGDDFQSIINMHPAGATFVLKEGLHRQQLIQAREGDTFLGELGAICLMLGITMVML